MAWCYQEYNVMEEFKLNDVKTRVKAHHFEFIYDDIVFSSVG